MEIEFASEWINRAADALGVARYEVTSFLAVVLVCAVCGAVGALVVGNRMAFFSDALAHCAFAGVALGLLGSIAAGASFAGWIVPTVMVAFGIAIGVAIAFVRERTGLASDTVIGVFFAGAVGFGGMLYTTLQHRTNLNPESFLFGSPLSAGSGDLVALVVLAALLAAVLWWRYNHFVLSSFNPSLARSRDVSVRACNYLFIILLALIVNLCLRAVGALLINAMLVVPAATAANLSRNLRQMFWFSVGLSLLAGLGGLWLSSAVRIPLGGGAPLEFGPAGTIVVIGVLAFFASVVWQARAERGSLASAAGAADNANVAP